MDKLSRSGVLHVARAASKISGCRELVIIGSAALIAALGQSVLSENLLTTADVDVFALDAKDPDRFADDLDVIGYGSQFHETNHYFADGVSPFTAMMPVDWPTRATSHPMSGFAIIVPDPNDIAVAKLCAWRERDRDWLHDAVRIGAIDIDKIASRIAEVVQRPDGAEPAPPLEERERRVRSLR